MKNAGFTLIELMIVVVIIGVLAAIAIPKFTLATFRAKEKEADRIVKQVYTLQATFRSQHSRLATTVEELQTVGFSAPDLEYYSWNSSIDTSPYCLTAAPGTGNHQDRCIDLTSGEISGRP